MNEFSLKLFINFNAHLTEALTITRLSLNIFLDKFYPNKVIPLINKLNIFKRSPIHLRWGGRWR